MRTSAVAVGAGALLVLAAGIGDAVATSAASPTYTACADAHGVLSLKVKGRCAKGTKAVSLAARGPAGPAGPAGATGATGAAGTAGTQGVQGMQGVQGVQGVQGNVGPQGSSRGWGAVRSDATLAASSGNVTVTPGSTAGVFCIAATGLDLSTAAVVATPDYSHDASATGTNASQSYVESGAAGSYCPTGQFSISTFQRTISSGVTTTTRTGEGFYFVIG